MKILACVKAVYDDQEIFVSSDQTLNYSRSRMIISVYDLNSLAAGRNFAMLTGAEYVALTVGNLNIDDSKMKKNILSRGPGSLYTVADDAIDTLDTHQTARVIKDAVEKIGGCDIIICGDGSADVYAQQTGIQLGELLGVPSLNNVTGFELQGDKLIVDRALEDEVQKLQVSTPVVLSVSSDICPAQMTSMKDILAAGKKPITSWTLADLGGSEPESSIAVTSIKAPNPAPRMKLINDGSEPAGVQTFLKNIEKVLAQ